MRNVKRSGLKRIAFKQIYSKKEITTTIRNVKRYGLKRNAFKQLVPRGAIRTTMVFSKL